MTPEFRVKTSKNLNNIEKTHLSDLYLTKWNMEMTELLRTGEGLRRMSELLFSVSAVDSSLAGPSFLLEIVTGGNDLGGASSQVCP